MIADLRAVSPVFLDLRGDAILAVPPPTAPCVLSLGNFDGVHRAHADLITASLSLRDQHIPDGLCGVFSFFHPSSDYRSVSADGQGNTPSQTVLRKPRCLAHLTTLKEKLRRFKALGVDFVCLCDFNCLRTLSPSAFIDFLQTHLEIKGVVCGFNFRFGIHGSGHAHDLAAAFSNTAEGRFCQVVPPFCLNGETVSATRIRQMLAEGDAVSAEKQLGYPYALEARVISGKQLGRRLGFPTANQNFLPEKAVPAKGVYAVICHTPHGTFPGVANVGNHPTVDRAAPVNCETYVIGYEGNLYGTLMRVEFLCRLREETKFPSPEALAASIAHDVQSASDYVASYVKNQNPTIN